MDTPEIRSLRNQYPPAFQPLWMRNAMTKNLRDRTLQGVLNPGQRRKIQLCMQAVPEGQTVVTLTFHGTLRFYRVWLLFSLCVPCLFITPSLVCVLPEVCGATNCSNA